MQLAVNIIVLSAIYALIACGYVLIYRVSRVLNLAHGEGRRNHARAPRCRWTGPARLGYNRAVMC